MESMVWTTDMTFFNSSVFINRAYKIEPGWFLWKGLFSVRYPVKSHPLLMEYVAGQVQGSANSSSTPSQSYCSLTPFNAFLMHPDATFLRENVDADMGQQLWGMFRMGKKCNLSVFDSGMIVGARQAGLHISISAELLRFPCTWKKLPVSGGSAKGKALLVRELNREWPDWLELMERLQKLRYPLCTIVMSRKASQSAQYIKPWGFLYFRYFYINLKMWHVPEMWSGLQS